MAKTQSTAPTKEHRTIAWFEREIMAHTPQTSILDATSLGIWSIAEEAGILAGTWKNHRVLLQDLDIVVLSAALGEMLAAVVRTANAVDLSLESLMALQVERVQTHPVKGAKPPRKPRAPSARQRAAPLTADGPDLPSEPPAKRVRKAAGTLLSPSTATALPTRKPRRRKGVSPSAEQVG